MVIVEEYIKILEEIVETYRSCSVNEEGFDMRVDIAFMKKECKALENLIAGYKQLEEKNEELRADNYELNNRITDLLENIPVQKVKENIQDLESRGYFEEANAMKDLLERSREDVFFKK